MKEYIQETWELIKSQKVNKKMIPIKAFGSFLYLATTITFPYLTLQMLNIGLNLNDVSIVYGVIPLTTFLTSPIAGYVGDKIGYNVVLAFNLVLAAVSSTAFDWTPRFHEYYRVPTITSVHNDALQIDEIVQFVWPPQNCSSQNEVTLDDCKNDKILQNHDFWIDILDHLCHNVTSGNDLIFELDEAPDFQYFEVLNNKRNGTMCQASMFNGSIPDDWNSTDYKVCYGGLQQCYESEGSHSKTFWIYFGLRMLYQMSLISVFSSFDGTALRQCREFGSDYAWVTFYGTIAAAVGPLIASVTIKDAPEGSEDENDYNMAFYVADGLLFIALITSLFLKVTIGGDQTDSKDKKKKENRKAVKKLFTPSALLFFAIIFQGGIMWGVKDTYLYVFLQDELGASSQFLGYMNTIAIASGVFVLPFAKWIIEKVGHVHICYLSIVVDAVRNVICTVVNQSPPNFVYYLAIFDALCNTLYWTSAIKYSYKIAPPTLVGTMAAMTGSVNWIVAKGLSSFVSGQFVGQGLLTIREMFQYVSLYSTSAATFFYIIYWIIGRKLEAKLAAEVERKRQEMEKKPQIENLVQAYVPSVQIEASPVTSL